MSVLSDLPPRTADSGRHQRTQFEGMALKGPHRLIRLPTAENIQSDPLKGRTMQRRAIRFCIQNRDGTFEYHGPSGAQIGQDIHSQRGVYRRVFGITVASGLQPARRLARRCLRCDVLTRRRQRGPGQHECRYLDSNQQRIWSHRHRLVCCDR
jgi:hypothetical protein